MCNVTVKHIAKKPREERRKKLANWKKPVKAVVKKGSGKQELRYLRPTSTSARPAPVQGAYARLLKEPYQVVYDIFCDACTELGSYLVNIKRILSDRGQYSEAQEYEKERVFISDQKAAVSEKDVPAQVELIEQWAKRQRRLGKYLDELCK